MSGPSFGKTQSGHSPTADVGSRTSGTLGLGVTLTMKTIKGVGSMCLAGQSLAAMDNGHAIAFVNGLEGGKTESSRAIAKSPVVVIRPEADIGRIIWNPGPAH